MPRTSTVTGFLLLMTSQGKGSVLDGHVWKDRFSSTLNLNNDPDHPSENDYRFDDSMDIRSPSSSVRTMGSINVDLGDYPRSPSQGWAVKNDSIRSTVATLLDTTDVMNHRRQLYNIQPYRVMPMPTPINEQADPGAISIHVDPSSLVRLLSLTCSSATSFTAAFMGTLRLLAPMYVGLHFLSMTPS